MTERTTRRIAIACAFGIVAFLGPVLAGSAVAQDSRPASRASDAERSVLGRVAVGVNGDVFRLGGPTGDRPAAVVFLDTECPISRKYSPILNDLAAEAGKKGVDFFGVIAHPSITRATARDFLREFAIGFPVLFDASGDLAVRLAPTHVPECFVFVGGGELIYRGRIDDLFADLGKRRARATTHELADAIDAASRGKRPATYREPPVGCVFEAWKTDALPDEVTWSRDIQPLFRARCASCHRPGGAGPFVAEDYGAVKAHLDAITAAVRDRKMPPWAPAGDTDLFRDCRRLSAREIALLSAFRDAGAPLGDPADAIGPAGAFADQALWDRVLDVGDFEFAPTTDPNAVREFTVPTGFSERTFVRSFGLVIDGDSLGRFEITAANAPGAWPASSSVVLPDGLAVVFSPGEAVTVRARIRPGVSRTRAHLRLAFRLADARTAKAVRLLPLPRVLESDLLVHGVIAGESDRACRSFLSHFDAGGRESKIAAFDGTSAVSVDFLKTPLSIARGRRIEAYRSTSSGAAAERVPASFSLVVSDPYPAAPPAK